MKTASNSRVLRIIPLLISIFYLSFPAQAQYGGGSGELNDPYQIATARQLISIGLDPMLQGKHFVLVNDIDLDPNLPDSLIFKKAVIPNFGGTFNGNGFVIRNLTISGNETYLGLFGKLESQAQVKDHWCGGRKFGQQRLIRHKQCRDSRRHQLW